MQLAQLNSKLAAFIENQTPAKGKEKIAGTNLIIASKPHPRSLVIFIIPVREIKSKPLIIQKAIYYQKH